jgi:uncharacterized protein YigE (DUF2233 family)
MTRRQAGGNCFRLVEKEYIDLRMRHIILATLAVFTIGLAAIMNMKPDVLAPLQAPPLQVNNQNTKPPFASNPCKEMSFERSDFIVCSVNPAFHRMTLHLKDASGAFWGNLRRFALAQKPIFAMNAGMYHDDLSPVGLYIENGDQIAPLNLNEGQGNFFMKPNGVFGIGADGKPFVEQSTTYASSSKIPLFATQSGPMLVTDDLIHPRFEPDGISRNVRNGVGINEDGDAIFVISKDFVSFGKFARFYRDGLKCPNALYFDGVVSAFSQGDSIVEGGTYPSGPILAVIDAPRPGT